MDLNTPNSIINESISNQKDADESQQSITEIIAQSTEPTEQQPQPMEQQKAEQTAQHQQQGQILQPQQQTTPPTQQMTQQQQCQQPSTDEDEEQSIVVIDPVDNEPIEIPMGKDGCVWLSTLEHAFPGAYGLKYKNPATGAKRMVSLDDSTKQFVTPPGGWSNKVFELIFRTAATTPAPAPAETGSKGFSML